MKPVPPIDSIYYEKKAIEEIAGIQETGGLPDLFKYT